MFGRGFSSKCKSRIKIINARLDMIQRKRNAMQRFLKKDIADLLAKGLDIDAYGRAEGLLAEFYLSSCYDFVEHFCRCLLKHLSTMQKQRECPEDCKEAVQSLIFAAARFADLPELRNLRQIFQERYGTSLEDFANKEFVRKLSSKPPTRDKKFQLMQDISQEFSIVWDSKGFEQKIFNSSASVQDQPKKHDISSRGRQEVNNGRRGPIDSAPAKDKQEDLSHERPQHTPTHNTRNQEKIDSTGKSIVGNTSSALKEDSENAKPLHSNAIPPPYIKLKINKYGVNSEANEVPMDPPIHKRDVGSESVNIHANVKDQKPKSVRTIRTNPPVGPISIKGDEVEEGNSNVGPVIYNQSEMDEEKMMDKLLIHYSEKKQSRYEQRKVRIRLKDVPSHHVIDEAQLDSELGHLPARAFSLPPESTTPAEILKGPARAASFQPEILNQVGHVHPKLPDYDDLAARFAALKGK